MRFLAAVAAGAIVAVSGLVGTPSAWANPLRAAPVCSVKPGVPSTGVPWAQTRLGFQRVWPVTRGAGVVVAVVDTGLDTQHPQLAGVHTAPGIDVVNARRSANTVDCDGHGTMVTSIIAGQQVAGAAFVGVAPDATIVPIKQTTNGQDGNGTADGIARGIEAAITAHARVVNLSVYVQATSPQLELAVRHAAAAGLVIVAAAGNEGDRGNPLTYPAAYATSFDNVVAVGATADAQDTIAAFSEHGDYVTVCAPGSGIETPSALTGYATNDGTSFAAPFVTGTVALMLAAHPELSPAEVRARLEATADPPPASVPDPRYGYGIVDPYLAVTSVRDTAAPASSSPARALPAPPAPHRPDRHLQHVALAGAAALFGAAAVAVVGAAVLRAPRGRRAVT